MNFIEERIRKDGCVKSGDVLKVDAFLNHQIDVPFMQQIGEEFHRLFQAQDKDIFLKYVKCGSEILLKMEHRIRM